MKNLVSTLALTACIACATVGFAQSSSVGAGKENQQGTMMNGTGDSSAMQDNATKGNMPMKKKKHHKKAMSSDSSMSNGSGSMSSGSGSMSSGSGSGSTMSK